MYLLEGRVHLLISGDPVGRLAYAVVANLLIGTVFTLYVMSVFRRRGGIPREYFGFQPAKRTPTIRNRDARQSVPTLSRTRASSVTQGRSGSNGCSPGGCTIILERIPEDYPTLLKCFTQPQKIGCDDEDRFRQDGELQPALSIRRHAQSRRGVQLFVYIPPRLTLKKTITIPIMKAIAPAAAQNGDPPTIGSQSATHSIGRI